MSFLAQCFELAICNGRVESKFGPGVSRVVAERLNRNLQIAVRQSQRITAQRSEGTFGENPVYTITFANDGPQFGSITVDFSHGETTVTAVNLREI